MCSSDLRGGEPHHAAADRRAEHVGGVVGAERPAEKKPARQENEHRDFHLQFLEFDVNPRHPRQKNYGSNRALDAVDGEPVGDILGGIGEIVDMLHEVAKLGLMGEIETVAEDRHLQAGADLVAFLFVEHHLVHVIGHRLGAAKEGSGRRHQGLDRMDGGVDQINVIGSELFDIMWFLDSTLSHGTITAAGKPAYLSFIDHTSGH